MKRWISVVAPTFALLAFATTAQAGLLVATAFLDGPSENPSSPSPGTGFARVTFDNIAHTLRVEVNFSDLIGTTTAAHIHAPAIPPANAGVATTVPTFTGFPLGVTLGTYDHVFDTTMAGSFNPAFVTLNGGSVAGAEAALVNAIADGHAYLNIHSTFRPGGEIRGFLQPVVPEPSTIVLAATGLCALVATRCRRRKPVA